MKRLFVFAIGGTGSRVLKSLAMLLAAGVRTNQQSDYEVIPIIVDPHKSNDDLKRTVDLLRVYGKIAEHATLDGRGFFGTKIKTLDKITSSAERHGSSFTFQLQEVSNSRFRDYIEADLMQPANRALTELLFSGTTHSKRGDKVDLLDIEMEIGFVGNPNVGSVVLNQFSESREFKDFASNFNESDRIFIISSIFGGTGAAGFPVILKNLRDAMNLKDVDAKGFLQNAKIGSLTVMPYFNVESDGKSAIKRGDFISKTRAALHYYQENVTGNNSVNAMYYIADPYHGKAYKNDPGYGGQRNDAHFVELASALAIIDFMGMHDDMLRTTNGIAEEPVYKEFAVRNDKESLVFNDLSDETLSLIRAQMTKMSMFVEFMRDTRFHETIGSPDDWMKEKPQITPEFIGSTFVQSHLQEFIQLYLDWLEELSRNRRGFAPFNIGNIENLIADLAPKSSWLRPFTFERFRETLNEVTKKPTGSTPETKLLDVLHQAATQILARYYDIKG
ncbi:MAG: hypothetical protein FGM24_08670 [Candidatus Kapabacteria bacterium]|nr:hypothetical protein [Candidatus Kapabacteria bacterium]